MAKTQFDRHDVVAKSAQLFWRHGYSGSSMQQIFDVTGLKSGSIYLAFGGKENLFRESLHQYANSTIEMIHATCKEAPSAGVAICTILNTMVFDSTQRNYCSCFLVKSQQELATDHSDLHEYASEQLRRIEAIYTHYLAAECDEATAKIRVTSLMLHIFGLGVYGYHQGAEDNMLCSLREGLSWLPWSEALQ